MIELLKQRLVSETDYIHEAADTKLMAEAFRGHPFIHIPEVLAEFSSANVLTTEFAVGARYHDVLGWDQEQRDLAGEAVFRFHYRCIYLVGRHSADPHPGNYVFGPDGALWCLDFGAMWDTSPDFVSDTERLLEAVSAEGVVFESDPEEDEEEDGDTEAAQAQAPAQAQQGDHEQQGQPEGAAPAAVAPVPRPFKDAVFVGWLLDQCGCGEERQLPFPGVQPRGPGGNVLGVHFDDEQRDMAKRLFGTHRGNVDTLRAMQAVVATLGSRRDWGAIAREYWPFTAAPPSTPLGELEARWQEDRR